MACGDGELVGSREGNDIFSALITNVFVTREGSNKSLLYRVIMICSCKEV